MGADWPKTRIPMEEKKTTEPKISQSELDFRKAILGVKEIQAQGVLLAINSINDLDITSTEHPYEEEGSNKFEATAEIHFILKEGDMTHSDGSRKKISGCVNNNGGIYSIEHYLIIEENIKKNHLKQINHGKSKLQS